MRWPGTTTGREKVGRNANEGLRPRRKHRNASSETIAEVSAEMKQHMLVMYNNVTETADEAMNNIACEI